MLRIPACRAVATRIPPEGTENKPHFVRFDIEMSKKKAEQVFGKVDDKCKRESQKLRDSTQDIDWQDLKNEDLLNDDFDRLQMSSTVKKMLDATKDEVKGTVEDLRKKIETKPGFNELTEMGFESLLDSLKEIDTLSLATNGVSAMVEAARNEEGEEARQRELEKTKKLSKQLKEKVVMDERHRRALEKHEKVSQRREEDVVAVGVETDDGTKTVGEVHDKMHSEMRSKTEETTSTSNLDARRRASENQGYSLSGFAESLFGKGKENSIAEDSEEFFGNEHSSIRMTGSSVTDDGNDVLTFVKEDRTAPTPEERSSFAAVESGYFDKLGKFSEALIGKNVEESGKNEAKSSSKKTLCMKKSAIKRLESLGGPDAHAPKLNRELNSIKNIIPNAEVTKIWKRRKIGDVSGTEFQDEDYFVEERRNLNSAPYIVSAESENEQKKTFGSEKAATRPLTDDEIRLVAKYAPTNDFVGLVREAQSGDFRTLGGSYKGREETNMFYNTEVSASPSDFASQLDKAFTSDEQKVVDREKRKEETSDRKKYKTYDIVTDAIGKLDIGFQTPNRAMVRVNMEKYVNLSLPKETCEYKVQSNYCAIVHEVNCCEVREVATHPDYSAWCCKDGGAAATWNRLKGKADDRLNDYIGGRIIHVVQKINDDKLLEEKKKAYFKQREDNLKDFDAFHARALEFFRRVDNGRQFSEKNGFGVAKFSDEAIDAIRKTIPGEPEWMENEVRNHAKTESAEKKKASDVRDAASKLKAKAEMKKKGGKPIETDSDLQDFNESELKSAVESGTKGVTSAENTYKRQNLGLSHAAYVETSEKEAKSLKTETDSKSRKLTFSKLDEVQKTEQQLAATALLDEMFRKEEEINDGTLLPTPEWKAEDYGNWDPNYKPTDTASQLDASNGKAANQDDFEEFWRSTSQYSELHHKQKELVKMYRLGKMAGEVRVINGAEHLLSFVIYYRFVAFEQIT